MSAEFQPQNNLESRLMAAQDGQIPPEAFIQTLPGSEVFMPIYEKHQIGGFAPETKAKPLKVQAENGTDVLVLFTSPDRAKAFVGNYPGFSGGLVAEFTWILERHGIGYGISLNPGEEVGIDFRAQNVAQIATLGGQSI